MCFDHRVNVSGFPPFVLTFERPPSSSPQSGIGSLQSLSITPTHEDEVEGMMSRGVMNE